MAKLRPLTYPSRLEARYRRQLLGYVQEMHRLARPILLQEPSLRRDALADDVAALLGSLKSRFRGVWNDARLRGLVMDVFQRVNAQNAREFASRWGGAIPAVPIDDAQAAAMFVAENVALIKSIDERYFGEIERIMLDATDKGLRSSVVAKTLTERFDVSKSRARLIARDQIGKLVGQLTVKRQQAAGVEQAKWSTSLDERVRKSHRAAEGKVFNLDEGLSINGNMVLPGEEIQCRCSSIPIVPEFD